MTIGEKIAFLWNKALEDAIGAGHADPFGYADAKVAHLQETRHRVERAERRRGI